MRGWGTHPSAGCCSPGRVNPAPTHCVPGRLCHPGCSRVPGAGKRGFNFPNISSRATPGTQLSSTEMETSVLAHPCSFPRPTRVPEGFRDGRRCRSHEHEHPTPSSTGREVYSVGIFGCGAVIAAHSEASAPHMAVGRPSPTCRAHHSPDDGRHPWQPTQTDFGNSSSSPYKGWWLPNPALHVAAIPQPSALLGATSQLWTQPEGIGSPPPRALHSLLGKQIEKEDATRLSSVLIPWSGKSLSRTHRALLSQPRGAQGGGAMSRSRS